MKKYLFLNFIIIFFIFVVCTSLSFGAYKIPISKLPSLFVKFFFTSQMEGEVAILFSIRIPRILLGILVGAGLGYSGTLIQGLFKNPIAEPGLIGVSSGASLFATGFIVLSSSFHFLFGNYSLAFFSFLGSFITLLLVYFLSTRYGTTHVTSLLLSGIAISAIARAIIGLFVYISTEEQLRSISFWNLGSLSGSNWTIVPIVTTFVVPSLLCYPFLYKSLNVFTLGEREAFYLGINVELFKKILIFLICFSVGGSIAFVGMIDFIGLVSPHLGRLIIGSDHRFLLPVSSLLGASLLVLADLLSRTIVAPAELPIGILTSALGSPFFLYLVIKNMQERKL